MPLLRHDREKWIPVSDKIMLQRESESAIVSVEAIALYSAIGAISERRDEKSPAPEVDALIFGI